MIRTYEFMHVNEKDCIPVTFHVLFVRNAADQESFLTCLNGDTSQTNAIARIDLVI